MKALSIQQPWAYCITHGTKRVENRTWYTSFRGRFLIHAGKKYQIGMEIDIYADSPEVCVAGMLAAPRGAIVGVATLADCLRCADVQSDQKIWSGEDWCFVLRDVRSFAIPIPAKGALGFFDYAMTESDADHFSSPARCEPVRVYCGGAASPIAEREMYDRIMRGEA